MDCNNIYDIRNANCFHFSSHSGYPPPLKRMRHSLSSSLDMNDNSSMEYDNNADQTYEYRTDQSVEYPTETSMPSQDMMTCSSTCTSTAYPRSTAKGILTASQPVVRRDEGTPLRHKRRLMNVGSNTFSSCSTNVSQSSTLTELSQMDDEDDNVVLIDDITPDLSPPKFVSGDLYREGVDTESNSDKNDVTNESLDVMMIDSLVTDWDQNFVLHASTMYHTDRRTKEQVKQAKRSIHRIHFQT